MHDVVLQCKFEFHIWNFMQNLVLFFRFSLSTAVKRVIGSVECVTLRCGTHPVSMRFGISDTRTHLLWKTFTTRLLCYHVTYLQTVLSHHIHTHIHTQRFIYRSIYKNLLFWWRWKFITDQQLSNCEDLANTITHEGKLSLISYLLSRCSGANRIDCNNHLGVATLTNKDQHGIPRQEGLNISLYFDSMLVCMLSHDAYRHQPLSAVVTVWRCIKVDVACQLLTCIW